jgi:hypothetical protein
VSYIYSADVAREKSYYARFWRDSIKERTDYRLYSDGEPKRSEAYDGHLVRQLNHARSSGAIETAAAVLWNNRNRVQPISFLYEYITTPYWQIVRDGHGFSCRTVEREGTPYVEVSIRHPVLNDRSFVLTFDLDGRLRRRDTITKIFSNEPVHLAERHEFFDYADYRDESGEVIHFPQRIVYHYYVGALPDGTPVEYSLETIRVTEIKWNKPIDNDVFVLTFPDHYLVRDGLHGLGETRAADLPHLRQRGRTRTGYIVAAVTIPAGLLLLGAAAWWHFRHRRGKRTGG